MILNKECSVVMDPHSEERRLVASLRGRNHWSGLWADAEVEHGPWSIFHGPLKTPNNKNPHRIVAQTQPQMIGSQVS
jgi:hypothetical protein